MNCETLKNKLKPIVYPIINFIPRRRLKNKNFTIICDNCWAGKVYQELGLPYQTPFVGMFVFSPDYIKMLKNLKYYLSGNIPLTFVKESKYIKDFDNAYPLALLDDIELHFLHYADEEEATQKWNRRLERIHWDNLYFKFNDIDVCTYELMKEFEELPKLLLKKRTKLLCVNDDLGMTEDDLKKFSKILSERYPEKSRFEL